MTGAGAVVALVLLAWSVGSLGVSSWTQSWGVVRRGHFRIVAWTSLILAVLALLAVRADAGEQGTDTSGYALLCGIFAAAVLVALLSQYLPSELAGAAVGAVVTLFGVVTLARAGWLIEGWSPAEAALHLVGGAVMVGAVTNGMLLGHWYLNQPGLKPWALARLTTLSLIATGATGVLGLIATGKLTEAATEGAVLGIPGFGASFGTVFFLVWLALVCFTGVIVWMARRCVNIRSIQSATGLYYVALLTAGVAEFLVRYLMITG